MLTSTGHYRTTSMRTPEELRAGLDAGLESLIGRYRRRPGVQRRLRRRATEITQLESDYSGVSDARLREQLHECREHFRRYQEPAAEWINRGLAAIREAARRCTGLHPFPVQLMTALALYRGGLAEMATGEGKTLAAGLAGALAGWHGRPCHVVTVNDYLARRDAELLRTFYRWCGLSVGIVTSESAQAQRLEAYGQDIVYTTSKEILADFLRDRLRLGAWQQAERRHVRMYLSGRWQRPDGVVMRGLHTAIIDEADSVLIDEAVTPLIISQQRENKDLRDAARAGQHLALALDESRDYRVNLRYKEIELTDDGRAKLETIGQELPGIWRGRGRAEELVRQALVAQHFFLLDKQYVIADGKVVIVDEFTGRQMPMRTWRQGLHQAIEAKEGIDVSQPSETLGRLSFQRFFRFFHRLSGMTATASESAGELWRIYGLAVIPIPTNRPCIRDQWPDQIFPDAAAKWDAITASVLQLHASGRPLLIGTRSVAASEFLAERLAGSNVGIEVLNAVRHQEEARIVAEAGRPERITIATNMAGRGTDIKLGDGVAGAGGLHVIATERHESGRIDRQLFGRAARQGDPGSAQAFISLEDELLKRFLPRPLLLAVVAASKRGAPGAYNLARQAIRLAQYRAQRLAYRQRHGVMLTDTWLADSLSFAGGSEIQN